MGAAARLEVVERKVRAAGKSKNGACTGTCSLHAEAESANAAPAPAVAGCAEKALSQLRSSTTALLRATGHVQSAKRTVDAAFAELLRLTGPPTAAASGAPTSPA